MPQFTDYIRYSVVAARAAANNDNNNGYNNNDDNLSRNRDDNPPNHRSVEIGVIVAIIVAGLAIIGGVATFIYKRRQRQQKRAVKQAQHAENEIEWYGPGDGVAGKSVGGQESGVQTPVKKEEGEVVPPPSYQIAVSTGGSTGGEKGVAL